MGHLIFLRGFAVPVKTRPPPFHLFPGVCFQSVKEVPKLRKHPVVPRATRRLLFNHDMWAGRRVASSPPSSLVVFWWGGN